MGGILIFLRNVRSELSKLKFYILAAVLLFSLGVYQGYTSNELDELLLQVVNEAFGEMGDKIASSDNPTMASILLIFLNNVRAILFMMIFGLIAGVFPVLSTWFNGVLVAFVLRMQEAAGASMYDMIFKGLLPHGLLELPVIFIAAGYGIRLGMTVIRRIFPSQREKLQTVGQVIKAGISLFGFLVILLFFASIIESTVTYWLLSGEFL